MDSKSEKGTTTVDLDGVSYSIQYEIADLRDGWFTLTIWYRGRSCTERVPWYTINPHDDVHMPHGMTLLRRLFRESGVSDDG